jgi:hypothetical protein
VNQAKLKLDHFFKIRMNTIDIAEQSLADTVLSDQMKKGPNTRLKHS